MPAEQVGMPAGAPTETCIVVELEDLGDRTEMVMTHIGVPADSPVDEAGRWRSTNSMHASLNSETRDVGLTVNTPRSSASAAFGRLTTAVRVVASVAQLKS